MRQLFPYLLCLVLIGIIVQQCNNNNKNSHNYKTNIDALTDSVKHYRNSLGTKTATIKTLQGSKKQIEDMLLKKDAELKALSRQFTGLKSITKIESYINIDTIKVALENPSRCDRLFKSEGKLETKWYTLGYKVTSDSLTISPFTMHTETTVITGFKRKWFLGRQTLVTDITNNNPYINIDDIKSAEVTIAQPWYKKWYVWLATGIIVGIIIK